MDHGSQPLTDADLDREIQAALAADPSPQFVARVRTELRNAPIAPKIPWGWAAAAACASTVVIVMLTPNPNQIAAGLKPSPTNERPTNESAMHERPTHEASADRRAAVVPARRPPSAKTATSKEPALPEVIVDPENLQAFQQLILSVRERRFEASFDDNPPSTPVETSELTMAPPIIIEPLEPPAANN